MRRSTAALGSGLFLACAPGVVAGLVPWIITGWRAVPGYEPPWPVGVAGGVLVIAGSAVLVAAFVRFVREGVGTPAPVGPTEALVVGGSYRYVRNPMYLAVIGVIVGQVLLLGSLTLLLYAVGAAAAMATFARFVEEPALQRRFGRQYDDYRAAVPAWVPRRPPRPTDP